MGYNQYPWLWYNAKDKTKLFPNCDWAHLDSRSTAYKTIYLNERVLLKKLDNTQRNKFQVTLNGTLSQSKKSDQECQIRSATIAYNESLSIKKNTLAYTILYYKIM